MYDKRIEIAPSILSASFASVLNALRDAEEAGAEYLHLDVMDGVFVPQITFGSKFIKDIRPHSDLLFDAHLMIVNPENHIDDFIDAGCNMITIHQESTVHLHRVLSHIKERGVKCGISIVPSTPVSVITPLLDMVDLVLVMTVNPGWAGQKLIPGCINKIVELKELRESEDYDYAISVDGGVNLGTIQDVVAAGADIAVAGSAFYNESDKLSFMQRMQELAMESFK